MKLWTMTLLFVAFPHWTTAIQLTLGNLVLNFDQGTLKSIPARDNSTHIDLSGLQIRYIEKATFDNFTNVRSLDLSNNKLRILPPLNKLHNLEELSVANNELEFLTRSFVGLNKLRHLNVSNNFIDVLKRGSLFGLTKSANVIIAGNPFVKLSSRAFEDPSLFAHKFAKESKQPHPVRFREKENHAIKTWPEATIPKNFRAKICKTTDGIVQSVSEFKNEEELGNCTIVRINRRKHILHLSHSRLQKFQRGWYNLSGNFINKLDLSWNDITDITPELLNDLPSGLLSIELKYNNIGTIKRDMIQNRYCRSLNVEHNFLLTIEDGAFENTNLTSLSVAYNILNNINFVKTLPLDIEILYLHNNAVSEIPASTFREHKKLQIISLHQNHVRSIVTGTFAHQENLLNLKLSYNQITELHSESFRGLKMVKKIDLTGNKIRKICRKTFSILKNLNKFDLLIGHNEIDTIEEGSFSDLNMILLDLSNNKIIDESIAEGAFNRSTLAKLNLGQNFITKINGELFYGISGTYHLSFYQNYIKSVQKGAAKYMANVSVLELSMNPLKHLKNGALYGLSKENDVYIELFETPISVIQGAVFDDV